MENKIDLLESYIREYEKMINADDVGIDWNLIKVLLVVRHGWTPHGAAYLMKLVDDYGSFILAHAYALAVVLKREDGGLDL